MENNMQFSGCTISSHNCLCMEKLSDAERKLFDDNSVKIKYKKGRIKAAFLRLIRCKFWFTFLVVLLNELDY